MRTGPKQSPGGLSSVEEAFGTRLIRATLGWTAIVLAAVLFAGGPAAHAALTVFVGEPFDSLGKALPVGHTTIYLDRVCADGPLKVRLCAAGEPAGVAISRYNQIGPYDWLATPILQFLYATDRAEDVLPFATAEQVDTLRQTYRRRFLGDMFPDEVAGEKQNSEWWESAGMAYSRRLWGYRLETTPEQDRRFVAILNARPNHHAYRAYTANCANFAADLVNIYFPGLVRRNRFADLGFTLPRQVARCIFLYGRTHPEAGLRVVVIPQVPGSIPRSWAVRGGAETFLKTKRYVIPLIVLQPEIAAALGLLYLDHGGWRLSRDASMVQPRYFEQPEDAQEASDEQESSQAAVLFATK